MIRFKFIDVLPIKLAISSATDGCCLQQRHNEQQKKNGNELQ